MARSGIHMFLPEQEGYANKGWGKVQPLSPAQHISHLSMHRVDVVFDSTLRHKLLLTQQTFVLPSHKLTLQLEGEKKPSAHNIPSSDPKLKEARASFGSLWLASLVRPVALPLGGGEVVSPRSWLAMAGCPGRRPRLGPTHSMQNCAQP